MGLTTAEKEGCRQILYMLDPSDLLSLYQTVVKTKTSSSDKAELIDRIIEKSNTAGELLNRRKVYRDYILQYLNDEQISMYDKSTKYDAMQRALEHWQVRDGEKDHYVQHEETEAENKTETASIKETKVGKKSHYLGREERKTANKAEPGSVKETKDGKKDGRVQREETETANRAAPGPVKEVPSCTKHLITLMSEQQKKQDQQYHIVKQLLDVQRENAQQLKDIKDTLTDLLQQIKTLIQQQTNLISVKLQQQQQDFQTKLMKDLAKQTEEQVKMLLKTSDKCKPHQTSYNKESPGEEVPIKDAKKRAISL